MWSRVIIAACITLEGSVATYKINIARSHPKGSPYLQEARPLTVVKDDAPCRPIGCCGFLQLTCEKVVHADALYLGPRLLLVCS